MGYDQQQQSNSWGAVIVVFAVFLLLAVVCVGGAGFFYVRTQRVAAEQAYRAEALARQEAVTAAEAVIAAEEAHRTEAMAQIQEKAGIAATVAETFSIEVRLDNQGAMKIDGAEINSEGLRARLSKLKKETNSRLSLQINVDLQCPVKHVTPILAVCNELGDIDYSIVSLAASDDSADRSYAEN